MYYRFVYQFMLSFVAASAFAYESSEGSVLDYGASFTCRSGAVVGIRAVAKHIRRKDVPEHALIKSFCIQINGKRIPLGQAESLLKDLVGVKLGTLRVQEDWYFVSSDAIQKNKPSRVYIISFDYLIEAFSAEPSYGDRKTVELIVDTRKVIKVTK